MAKHILILVFTFCLACSGNKSTGEKAGKTSSGITEFVINKEIYNFGDVISGEVVVYTFTISNTGKADLEINEIDAGCGCIEVKVKNIPLPPGEKGYLEVKFDSSGLYGKQFKTISLKVNTLKKNKRYCNCS